MPLYHYTCITRQGEWLEGEYDAPDAPSLEAVLQDNGLILVIWKGEGEVSALPAPADSKPGKIDARAITAEEGRARWATAPAGQRLVPKIDALAAMLPQVPGYGILKWITGHSHGAVTSRRDAFLVLALCAGFLILAVHISRHGTNFTSSASWPPVAFPPASQPDMSVNKINGQRRRTKTYVLDRVRASTVKTALDHAMRQTSLTTQLVLSSDNALVAKATPLDLELVDTLIPIINNDYGAATDNQALMEMVEQMSRTRANWMNAPHQLPAPTQDELQEDEMEKSLSGEIR